MGNCLGGNASTYPGNRRVAKPAYQPGDDEYQPTGKNTAVATAHFVTCPGGNALKLMNKPNRAEQETAPSSASGGGSDYVSVTLPDGVSAGDVIHVRAPDGRLNAITVPDGMGPGSTFTVEFTGDIPAPPKEEDLTPGVYVPTVVAEPEGGTGNNLTAMLGDDAEVAYDPNGGAGEGVEAKPTTGPYVPAYATNP